MFHRLIVVVLSCFCLITYGCKEQSNQKVLKCAHGLDVTHPVHEAMEFMAKRLEEKSNGKLTIEIYSNQQLGSERECLELIQIGGLDMTKVSAAVLANFAPQYEVFGLPYIFKNKEHQFRVLDGEVGQEILSSSDQSLLHGLAFYDSGSRSFYTKDHPIEKPEDLKGKKIRTMESPMAMSMISAMGGAATPISAGELYTALQAGVVDGAENNPPVFYLSRQYEVCKYFSIDEHTAIPDVLLIGTQTLNKLNENEKAWLKEAVQESVVYQRKLWKEAEEEAIQGLKEVGVTIVYPDKEPFANSVKELYEEAAQEEVIAEMINAIKSQE
ncbi:TRAP transporter substrate-binding protein [Zhouia amylolytica]|uniref:TRAP transporter substrate-binding protein n=1 Tax=Zhouia amylolytica TaxID=376730 RepID=UPI0020CD5EC0|nr:TRAP transporter substrate-binding protein [Zhouia amylolytica]MCQ0111826.1 TRAP transporter substrate-binding protein [Zhouia amylolytica]